MRTLLITLTLFCAMALRAQGTITVTPGVPVVGAPATFVLSPTYPPIGPVSWDFGDQTQPLSGGVVASHVYARTGSYMVRASYPYAAGQGLPLTVQVPVFVATRLGPTAPFTLSMLRLRWEDGRVDMSVEQGFRPLVAFADLKFEGTGLLQAQWVVDGIPLGTFAMQLAFAGTATLDSRSMIPLPTTAPGEHWVTLRILSPQVTFEPPLIRYFVKLGGEEAPQVDEVVPSAVRPGEERELRIRGRRLAPGMTVSFGKDIALVAPLRFPEPGWAIARVFVAPTAHPGFREAQAFSKAGRSRGPARLEVLPRPLGLSAAAEPLAAPPSALVAFLWSEGDGVARPSLVRALTAAFFTPEDGLPAGDMPSLFQVPAPGGR
ncbi:PKD domain-containing protein [Geothrix oryzisoli]|uniref:PKD domain-containing protein n=1 Tax=Geothrix oryzisoli TaxID=2922721 RepID=UPI001FAE4953|nr:PKD domain-containing protein [Geothrix oryzisoli]